jgi:hypothetical protein
MLAKLERMKRSCVVSASISKEKVYPMNWSSRKVGEQEKGRTEENI